MPILVPDVIGLAETFDSGTLGISQEILGDDAPSVDEPGLTSFEKALVETVGATLQPVITVISAAGGVLVAAQEIVQNPNVIEWPGIIAEKIAAPVADVVALMGTLMPPTADSLGNLVLAPVTANLKLPLNDYSVPAAEFSPVDAFPDVKVPIPAMGDSKKPAMPTVPGGPAIPPALNMLLAMVKVPINFMFQAFELVADIFSAILDPTKIADAITGLLELPSKLLPTLDNIVTQVLTAMAVPAAALASVIETVTGFVMAFARGILRLFKMVLGLNDE